MVIKFEYHKDLETVKCWNISLKVETPVYGKSVKSGMVRVKVYNEKGMPHKVGIGIFMKIRNCSKHSNNTAMN